MNLSYWLQSDHVASPLLALLSAYLAGLLSSLTPCVYPMIPITLSIIGADDEKSWLRGWFLSSLYVLGMAFTYTIIGVIAVATGRIFGSITHTPTWYLILSGLMTFSALWMFEIIEWDPQQYFQRQKKHHHHSHKHQQSMAITAILLGLGSGFVAAPCTTPVLTVILAHIATEKSYILGSSLMFSFALGLGTLLVFVGSSANLLKQLPRSGKWLIQLKKISALILLLMADYFLYKAGTLS